MHTIPTSTSTFAPPTFVPPIPSVEPARRDLANRRRAVVGLAVIAGVLGALGVLLAVAGATVLAIATLVEAALRVGEAIGVHRHHAGARKVARAHCIVGVVVASLALPLGVFALAANAMIFRDLNEA